jgi:hypothetical protein
MWKSLVSAVCSIPGSWGFHRLLYRQGVVAFEAKERKKFTKVLEELSSIM